MHLQFINYFQQLARTEFSKNYFGRDLNDEDIIQEFQSKIDDGENSPNEDYLKCIIWMLKGSEIPEEDLDVIYDIIDSSTPEILKLWGDFEGKNTT